METVGLSPKALAAALVPLIPGIVLVILGVISGDDVVRNFGLGLLSAAPLAGGAAAYAPPGDVRSKRSDRSAVKRRVILHQGKDPKA